MSASFYELLKFIKKGVTYKSDYNETKKICSVGLQSPDMTAFDKLRASKIPLMRMKLNALKSTYNGEPAIGIEFLRNIPKKCTVTAVCIQYGTNKDLGYTEEVGGSDYGKVNLLDNPDYDVPALLKERPLKTSSSKTRCGRYAYKVGVGTHLDYYIYAIAHVKYTLNGAVHTQYCGTVLAATYNTSK